MSDDFHWQLHDVRAMRWLRDPGRDPAYDNAERIIEFIGRDRVMGEYTPRLGDDKILFRSRAYEVGVVWLKPSEWVVFSPESEPFTMSDYAFQHITLIGNPIGLSG